MSLIYCDAEILLARLKGMSEPSNLATKDLPTPINTTGYLTYDK